jgi:hypothetical protein
MPRNIAMQDAATIMTDEEEPLGAVGKRWNREEAHGDYGFTVVAQKSHERLADARCLGARA